MSVYNFKLSDMLTDFNELDLLGKQISYIKNPSKRWFSNFFAIKNKTHEPLFSGSAWFCTLTYSDLVLIICFYHFSTLVIDFHCRNRVEDLMEKEESSVWDMLSFSGTFLRILNFSFSWPHWQPSLP